MTRSTMLGALAPALMLLAGACAATPAPVAEAALATPATTTTTTLTAPGGRIIDVTIIAPAAPRGVILFSHGGGSAPSDTPALFARLTERGFAVIVPTHTDSRSMPAERRTDLRAAFMTRIADMQTVAGYAQKAFPGLPTAQLGYSYGSATSLVGGGAFASMIPGSNPSVKAVVMYSTPGPIAPLTSAPGAFDAVKVPTLLITGDADKVPGFADDPAAHLVYFNQLPAGDHTALVVKGATHEFFAGNQPGNDEVTAMVEDFLLGRVLGDAAANARFDASANSALVTIKRR